jgi:glyoxylase-like metal-dependent hydrolase (beta-lactamase superfamily II)
MASLTWSTYVAGSRPTVAESMPPGEKTGMMSPISSTLISGERDAVLVDALLTMDQGRGLADWVAASGRNLTKIYITHGHGDHFFGASLVLERFPEAKMVATRGVVEHMRQQLSDKWLDGYWRKGFPGQIAEHLPIAEPLADDTIELEGEKLVAVGVGHTDTDEATVLHVPSLGLVVAGDAVYNRVHPYLVEAGDGGIQRWLAALDTLASLRPSVVIAGHKPDGADDDADVIEQTRQYLREFASTAQQTENAEGLYEAMLKRYPDRINPSMLWNSAHAMKMLNRMNS